ncbi:MAG: energy transducer TonB [Spirochaetales bacterium]|nr:energy transducer TonB [Spirochaetales bacterium]
MTYQKNNDLNIYLVISIALHAILLVLVMLYLGRTTFIFESKERNINITMTNVSRKELSQLRQARHQTTRRTESVHRGYKNMIDGRVAISEPIQMSESTNTYEITHSKTKPMQVYNKPQPVFGKVKMRESVQSDLEALNEPDDESELTFVNGESRGVLDSCQDELGGIGLSRNANVKLELVINAAGEVLSATLITSTGDMNIDAQIVSVLTKWRFEPGDTDRQTVIVNLKYFIK